MFFEKKIHACLFLLLRFFAGFYAGFFWVHSHSLWCQQHRCALQHYTWNNCIFFLSEQTINERKKEREREGKETWRCHWFIRNVSCLKVKYKEDSVFKEPCK